MNINDGGRRRFEDNEHTLRIYPGTISEGTIYCPIPARKNSTAAEVIDSLINRLHLDKTKCYVLAEVKEFGGEEWILNPTDCPVQRMMLWPRMALENRLSGEDYRFLLREKNLDGSIHYGSLQSWLRVTEERRRMMERGFLPQPQQKDFDDLCSLPDLNEKTLLENLRNRFKHEKIYTYVGSILIAINPFKFLPIYNPKYVKMYDNHQLGKLEPHIYAVADVAYHAMLQRKRNQCIVISGESGSGKTQSTNFLIHHLTALSQKGFASGVEQIILGAGPVLEAFGNAKTAHNNNSSRFGKFIQVNYQETGTVLGAYVEKYLLEKSRLVYQEHNERNYHVFYYLLAGASEEERLAFHLKQPEEYHYLNQITKKPLRQSWDDYCYDSEPDCFTVEGEDLRHDFERLQLAMEMVGFLPKTRRQIFSLLSAILHLGNICYKKKTYRDDSIDICNPEVLPVVSELLEVKEEMLFEALVTRKTVTVGEKLILPYKLAEAVTVRNSMAKSLYSALFDWIVFRINHALMNSKDLEQNIKTLSIGVLDIFGFEDYENNSFEQFCINFANERLQHYFNQHIFKLEQEEYRAEGISWHNIDYIDNTCCINLISKKPTGLLHLLDEESNFPQATNQTLLDKFKHQHEENSYIEFPAVMEPAFIIKHYAGKVKYGVKDFREKNTDHMRPDIVALLRSSKNAFISGMIGIDPVAVFRWAVLRAFFRAVIAFREAGKRHIQRKTGHDDTAPCAVLKSMDSISFLQHPVHQRSLEILQRCKEEKYSITRKNPRTPLSDLQGMNTLNEKNQHETFDFAWNGRTGIRQSRLSSNTSLLDKDGIFANSAGSKLLERAHGILTRNKNVKSKPGLPKHLLEVKSLKHLTRLTLQDRITKSLLHLHKKKKPPSISAQFQASLSKLMETLDQAEPYFVKCIRSNAEKLPLRFSDALVLRQLRYTGMLETVRIRQSGYSCKYSFQDFVSHFHVLLPRNIIPSKFNIQDFFRKINLNPDNYQVGKSMVFLKEQERQHLQDLLHQEVLRRIILLQRWFRALLCRQHFLHLRQASVIIQRFWRNYLNQKQVRDAAVQQDALVMASAATLLQASWRAYLERQRYLELRTAAIVIQQKWREHYRRRHLAAICIQARWKGYRESKRYQEQRNKIILLQSLCRGFRARQRFKALKEQRLKKTKLKLGLANIKPYGTLEIHGSDPSEWEDCSFDNRVKAIEECKSVIESNRISHESSKDCLNESPNKRQERARSRSGMDLQGDVTVRERPKSLEDLHQKKVGRAKRESRRMRELEQAIFSLELLKVRSLGGVSPSEERRWSTELMPEGLQSLQGTPDSESSQGSLELLSCEESQKSKLEPIILDEGDVPFLSPKISSSPNFDSQDNALSTSSETNYTLIQKRAPSDSVHLKNGAMKEKLVCSSESITCKPQLRDSFISNSLPTFFYIPQQDPLKTRSQLDTSVQRNKLLESEETLPSLTLDINREARKYHFPGENQVVASLNTDSSNIVLKKLEKLNTEKEERQKQLQQQNEKEMMEQIRQQTDILEKERKAFKTIEKPRTGETFLVPSFHQSKQRIERPSSLLILNTPNKDEPSVVGTPSVTVKDAALAPKDSPSAHLPLKDRPVTVFFERKGGPCQSSAVKELSKTDRMSTQLNVACKLSNNRISKREHLRPTQPCSYKSDDPFRDGTTRAIFFTPKENMSSSLVTKEALNSGNPQLRKQDEPASKPVKLTGPGQREQVARPAHKKKARMARTRSDFLTRGTFADGEGDTEEDDYDDIIEPLLSLDQASHSELGPAPSLGQASHSDSEMTSQRFSSVDEEAKLHKTMSQGEITKLAVRQKASDSDIRPQRAKMRFWAKGKQGEKKTTRVKPATHSEVSALFAGSDMIPAHQFPDELSQNQPTPPLSPELPGSCRKEFKENKEPSPKARRKRNVKISSVALESMHWQNDSVQIIASASDLKSMDEFLLKKMNDLDNEDSKKDTLVDVVFKKALKEFRQNIFSFYSSALAIDDGKSIRYKDLYALFEQILEKTMRLEQRDWSESPVRVWVNTFKVFLDEYMNEFKTLEYIPTKVPKTERKKRRKKETDLVEEHNGHIFKATQYSIPTYCEYCSSLIWIMDRASVCKLCKYACHKRCCLKTTAKCSKKYDPELSSRQFGVELSRLTSEDRTVPLVVEKLINYIEMHGLYTEGIYRKSGSTNKIKELRQGLDTDAENVNLDDYNIHVIASVFKQWLRDLPNPLMTFELYEEFLRAMGLQERKETIRGVYSVIDQLSRTHLNTLERLIFHLVRIALQEDTNRMSANALAIVFAPCILRCPDTIDPLQSVQDISKTTTCVELIVVEQMNKYKARLKDISSLEFAENKAKTRLSLIRRSMGKGRLRRGNYPCPSSPVVVRLPSMSDVPEETLTSEAALEADITEQQQAAMQQEERVLTEQIENLQKEKEELTFEMLVLEPRASDDETLESEASIGTADSSENLNIESEGAIAEKSERSLALISLKAAGKSEPSGKLRKQLKKQQDSLDSVDSSVSSLCSSSTASSHGTRRRFQIYSKSPFYRASSAGEALGVEGPLGQTKSLEDKPQFISRGTFNPEKGKQKLKNVKNSPQKTKETPEGTVVSGRRKTVDPDCSSTQQLALFGNNEFMV
ncbi:unconventional myosin-IXa isoform X1 [Balaenoptera ricei]|uniref:unconventional myosin-IXa isoform X1 n=1 Tax=Balaenoptera ricei TaxID=2746895 RepID=UPI0028BDB7DC|nr:unconventional myosin-IXa isoform X1 [Balaenoptera ricei]XP_059768832.1 unconventional myosin-IXa isoform X1 [Balaenoptera ricei]XP_059768833.1 unconventional myosin-IXa isoform X1 [Balaenoptera ricei]XP_059768834.1 unconventional myosin-IXa isoform X1 [Balaenoptera ricei]XP_059768835.1 unconventional myosin-IXa isoform X1 [Balaenoptera ricei]